MSLIAVRRVMTKSEPPVHVPDLPSAQGIDRLVALLEPLARVTQPKVYGIEHLPDDGAMLVGNHTIYGFLDLPFMIAEIWKRRQMTVRGLGEHAHYAIPVWRDALAMTSGHSGRGVGRDGSNCARRGTIS